MAGENKKKYLGKLPLKTINKYLQMELEYEGQVVLSRGAKKHILKKHREDFLKYSHLLKEVVRNPNFIGDDFNNKNKIELIKKVARDLNILLAVSIEMKEGEYHVSSFYCISDEKVSSRLRKGFLKRIIKY